MISVGAERPNQPVDLTWVDQLKKRDRSIILPGTPPDMVGCGAADSR